MKEEDREYLDSIIRHINRYYDENDLWKMRLETITLVEFLEPIAPKFSLWENIISYFSDWIHYRIPCRDWFPDDNNHYKKMGEE